jgi:hypothetical protein
MLLFQDGWLSMIIKSYEPLSDIIPALITVIAGVKTYYYRRENNE